MTTKLTDTKPKTDETKAHGNKHRAEHVYEPSDTESHHNPYDTKVGGKPACTLADGTVPSTVKQVASKAE